MGLKLRQIEQQTGQGKSFAVACKEAAVYQQAQRWHSAGYFEQLAEDLRAVLRLAAGRKAEPSSAILDSRMLARHTPENGERAGHDGAKRKQGPCRPPPMAPSRSPSPIRVTPARSRLRPRVRTALTETP